MSILIGLKQGGVCGDMDGVGDMDASSCSYLRSFQGVRDMGVVSNRSLEGQTKGGGSSSI